MDVVRWIVDLFLHVDEHLEEIKQLWGVWIYVVLFAIVFCETGLVITPFLPGDSLLFAVGALAAKGILSLEVVLPTLVVAAILGDSANYAIGQFFGQRMLAMKRFRLVKPQHLAHTHHFFEKYGGKTIFIARFVPIVRTIAPFVAGMGKMTYRRFMMYNVTGGIAWVVLCAVAGYLFGNLTMVKENFSLVILAIIVISLLPVAWEIHSARKRRRQAARMAASLETPDMRMK
ncbi:MAG: DedA family protein [Planctomycetaceae bacterium]